MLHLWRIEQHKRSVIGWQQYVTVAIAASRLLSAAFKTGPTALLTWFALCSTTLVLVMWIVFLIWSVPNTIQHSRGRYRNIQSTSVHRWSSWFLLQVRLLKSGSISTDVTLHQTSSSSRCTVPNLLAWLHIKLIRNFNRSDGHYYVRTLFTNVIPLIAGVWTSA